MKSAFRLLSGFTAWALAASGPALATPILTIGDSLTAEYETIPSVAGFSSEATAYAAITVRGWESLSWVEVLARVAPRDFAFGARKSLPSLWSLPRLSGYEFNWAIPGIAAGQYEDFVTSSRWANPAYFAFRQPLEAQLRSRVQRVVLWLGTNEFRARYGALYDGEDPAPLIRGLVEDLGRILDFVRRQNPRLQIVVVSVPDLGAAPSRRTAHPDPAGRARVTAAIRAANTQIEQLAYRKGAGYADTFAASARLIAGVPLYFGAIRIIDDLDADNDPHFAFTRDGLHPNTALQIENARAILRAFKYQFRAPLADLSDAVALRLLGINPHEPFYDWLASFGLDDRSFIADSDADGLPRLVEYAFGLRPTVADAVPWLTTADEAGGLRVEYAAASSISRYARVLPQFSTDRITWRTVPAARLTSAARGVAVTFLPTEGPHRRLRVQTIPPSGSTVSVAAHAALP